MSPRTSFAVAKTKTVPFASRSEGVPDAAALGRWLRSWVQPEGTPDAGAIYGFHNHSVWGDNPARYGDFTAGHSTFASPFINGLARALKQRPHERGQQLLESLLRFQSSSFQPDGQYRHIGFQVGETLQHGLVHNMVPNVALCTAAQVLGLPRERRSVGVQNMATGLHTSQRRFIRNYQQEEFYESNNGHVRQPEPAHAAALWLRLDARPKLQTIGRAFGHF